MSRRHRRSSAFTLLEVLLAILLTVGLMGAVYALHLESQAFRRSLAETASTVAGQRAVMSRIMADCRNAMVYPLPQINPDTGEMDQLNTGLVGDIESMEFVAVRLPGAAAWAVQQIGDKPIPSEPDVELVSYRLRRDDETGAPLGLERATRRVLAWAPQGDGEHVTLISSDIRCFYVRYHDGAGWTADGLWSGQDLPLAVEVWMGPQELPPDLDAEETLAYLEAMPQVYRRMITMPGGTKAQSLPYGGPGGADVGNARVGGGTVGGGTVGGGQRGRWTMTLAQRHSRGMILAAVLVVVALSAMVAAGVMFRISAETKAASAADHQAQAYAAAYSGVQKALAVAVANRDDMLVWHDNPDLFRNRFVASDGVNDWYFCVYSPADPGQLEVRYGLTDEAGKVNLNAGQAALLEQLPGMNGDLVDCLIDYIDGDDEPRPRGAEQAAYDFAIRNRPMIWTLEELLLVRGFTGQVVYGDDVNFNGLLDPNEDDADMSFPPDNADGVCDRGLLGCATVVSYDYDNDNEGRVRVNVNADAQALRRAGLPNQTMQFLTIWKQQNRPAFTHPAQLWGLSIEYQDVERDSRGRAAGRETRVIDSGITAENLDLVLDRLTPRPRGGQMIRGQINVNTAPLEVLQAICRAAGVSEDIAGRIVQERLGQDPADLVTPAWIVRAGIVDDPATFAKLAPYLTARARQFRLYSVGFSVPAGRFCVLEAVIDLARPTPRIAYLRDVTRNGVPFALDIEEIQY